MKDTQKRSRRADADNTFPDADLLVIANADMLSMQQYELTNNKWEDLKGEEKLWAIWKIMYKEAEAKAKLRFPTTDGKDQFGAAHCAEEVPPFGQDPRRAAGQAL